MRLQHSQRPPRATGAVRLRHNVALDGLRVRRHRVVDVVDSLAEEQLRAERDVVTAAEAEALVELGFADPVRGGTVVAFPSAW